MFRNQVEGENLWGLEFQYGEGRSEKGMLFPLE